jgi:hypothetical protein
MPQVKDGSGDLSKDAVVCVVVVLVVCVRFEYGVWFSDLCAVVVLVVCVRCEYGVCCVGWVMVCVRV